jgi:catechol 2,3-dioxygenase-like lactoylglutathione lyase family enzyme
MNEATKHASSHPILTSVAPQLFVADIEASCKFFAAELGFAVDFIYGDPPFYGQVSRDNARFVLRHVDEPVFREIREREHLLSAAVTVATVDEIKELFLSYESERVRFHQPLKKEPWGATTFVVEDPDGNLILFAGPNE